MMGRPAMEAAMASSQRYSFWTQDTVAAAVLAGVGMASLQSKLDGFANELNVPLITAFAHGWPLVVLFASLILMVVNSVGESREKEARVRQAEAKPEPPRLEPDLETAARALGDAVGDGLEEDRIEADPHWYVRLNVTEDCVSRARDSMCA
jgi:hypothetical protein